MESCDFFVIAFFPVESLKKFKNFHVESFI